MQGQSRILALLPLLFAFLLAACEGREPSVTPVPADIGRVADAFLKEMQAGNLEAAKRHVAPTARDELQQRFYADHKLLKKAGRLTPRFYQPKPKGMMAPQDSEATIVYAVRDNGKWTTAEIRVFRIDDEPYEVDYWKISNEVPQPNGLGTEFSKIRDGIYAMFGIMAFFAAVGLALIVWIVKRRPKLVSPDIIPDGRKAAITTRIEESE